MRGQWCGSAGGQRPPWTIAARRRSALVCLAVAWGLASGAPATAQGTSVSELKAAFVFNFAKFTDWPIDALAPTAAITLCIVNDAQITSALAGLVLDRRIGSHAVTVLGLGKIGEARGACHVLYAPALDTQSARELLGAVGTAPLLTVSDFEHFAELGGMANFILEDGKLRFAINAGAAQRARLQLRSQLLTLGRLTKGSDAQH